jgi:hypothetical protein
VAAAEYPLPGGQGLLVKLAGALEVPKGPVGLGMVLTLQLSQAGKGLLVERQGLPVLGPAPAGIDFW